MNEINLLETHQDSFKTRFKSYKKIFYLYKILWKRWKL